MPGLGSLLTCLAQASSSAKHRPGRSSLRDGLFVPGASLTPLSPWHLLLSASHSKLKPRCPGFQKPVFHYVSPMSHLWSMRELKDRAGSGHCTRAC